MTEFFSHSIKGIFFYAFLILILFPGLGVGLFSLRAVESNIKQGVKLSNLLVARSLAAQINEILSRSEKVIQVTGDMAQSELTGGRDMGTVLESVVESFPAFSHIHILDAQGMIRHCSCCSSGSIGYDLSRHPSFINALKQKGSCWSGAHIPIRESVPSITLSRRFNTYVVIAYLDLTELSRNVGALTSEAGIRAVILDRNANVAASSESGKAEHRVNLSQLNFVRQGMDGTFTSGLGVDEYGTPSIVSMAEIKTAKLLAITFRDADLALGNRSLPPPPLSLEQNNC